MSGDYARITPGALHRRRAPLDERLMARLPRLSAALRRTALKLSPRSRIRQALLKRSVQLAFSAYERGEFARAHELFYAPDVEFHGGGLGALPPDLAYDLRGREELTRWIERWHEGFAWIRYEVPEFLDFGETGMFTLHQLAEGRTSGARTELTTYSAHRLRDGHVSWQRVFRDRDEALRSIGVDPASVRLGPHGG